MTASPGTDISVLQARAKLQNFRQPVVEAFDYRLLLCAPSALELNFMTLTVSELDKVALYCHKLILKLSSLKVEIPFKYEIPVASMVHGFALWFDVIFDGKDEKVCLSTSPLSATTHWFQVCRVMLCRQQLTLICKQQVRVMLTKPLMVNTGDVVTGKMVLTTHERQSYDGVIEVPFILEQYNDKTKTTIGKV